MLVIRTTTVPMSDVTDGGYSADMTVETFQVSDPNTARVLYEQFRGEIRFLRMMLIMTGTETSPVPSVSVRVEEETL